MNQTSQFNEYRKAVEKDCIRAEEYLSDKLNYTVRISPVLTYSGDDVINKKLQITLYQEANDIDHKMIEVGYDDIKYIMKNFENTFEKSILQCAVFLMLNHPEAIKTYNANGFEKLLHTYINNLCAINCNKYYIHPDQKLCMVEDDTDIVYMDEITGLEFISEDTVRILTDDEVIEVNSEGFKSSGDKKQVDLIDRIMSSNEKNDFKLSDKNLEVIGKIIKGEIPLQNNLMIQSLPKFPL